MADFNNIQIDADNRTEKRKTGDRGENAAARYLEKNGFKVICRNFSCKLGEIDLIAVRKNEMHISFIEVKTRKNTDHGLPCEFVGRSKQKRLIRTAEVFLLKNPQYADYEMSMDIFEVLTIGRELYVRHLENAF